MKTSNDNKVNIHAEKKQRRQKEAARESANLLFVTCFRKLHRSDRGPFAFHLRALRIDIIQVFFVLLCFYLFIFCLI